jgi:hypothetical protein
VNDVTKLSPDQQRGLDEALRWEEEALAQLGAAELQRRNAETALVAATHRVETAAAAAREASAQCANVLRVISGMMQLPPGHWVYDKAAGKLVLKENHA